MVAATKDPSLADLAKQIETLKADIAKLTGMMGEYGSAKANAAADAARDKAAHLRAEGERYVHEAGQQAQDSAEAALDAVRKQPATAVAIAVGIGFLVGLVTAGRR